MERYPFDIGKFEIVKDSEIPLKKPDVEDIGTIQVGYFKDVKSLCVALIKELKIHEKPLEFFADLKLTSDKLQDIHLITLPIKPIIEAVGMTDINELTYDRVRKYGKRLGLWECPWETSLYYVLQRGSKDLNVDGSFSFISEPITIKGKPSYVEVFRNSAFMGIGSTPIDKCSYPFNSPRNRLVLAK